MSLRICKLEITTLIYKTLSLNSYNSGYNAQHDRSFVLCTKNTQTWIWFKDVFALVNLTNLLNVPLLTPCNYFFCKYFHVKFYISAGMSNWEILIHVTKCPNPCKNSQLIAPTCVNWTQLCPSNYRFPCNSCEKQSHAYVIRWHA